MSKAVQWTPDREGTDTRDAAKEAARLSGQTLGDWLDDVIADRASERGVAKADIDPNERLEAVAAQLARLSERRAGRVDGEIAEPAAADAAPAEFGAAAAGRGPAKPSDRAFLRTAVADIARRQADLDAVAEPANGADRGGAASPLPGQTGMTALHEAVAALESRLNSKAERSDPPRTDHRPRRSGAGSEGFADRGASAARLDRDAPPSGERETAPAPGAAVPDFEALARDLRRAIKDIDARPNVDVLDQHVRLLGHKVDGIGAGLPAGDALARIGEQTREVRDLLTAASQRPNAFDAVERQFAALEKRIGTPGDAPGRTPPNRDDTLTEIRALLDRFRPEGSLDALGRQIVDLASKIDEGFGGRSPAALIEDLGRRVDESHAALRSQLAATAVDTRPLEKLVRGVAEHIDDARRASANFQSLETVLRDLAGKVEQGRAYPDPAALKAFEAQFAKLAERLDHSEAGVAALDAVEQSLGELFSRLDETRRAAVEAAENAARTAARDTLRAAMQNPAASILRVEERDDFIGKVAQGFTNLRDSQDASDQRTQAALANLNRSIERLIEHLPDAAKVRAPAETTVPPPAAAASGRRPAAEPAEDFAGPLGFKAEAPPADRARRPRDDDRAAAAVGPADVLIEPGSGRGPVRAAPVRVPDGERARPAAPDVAIPPEADSPASFIAAARRAAQAAQASAASAQAAEAMNRAAPRPRSGSAASAVERARAFLVHRRRPILLCIAGLVLLLGALEVVKAGMAGPEQVSSTAPDTVVAAKPAVERAQPGEQPVAQASAPPAAAQAAAKPPAPFTPTLPMLASAPAASKAAASVANSPPMAGGGDLAAFNGLGDGLRARAAAGDTGAQFEVALRFAEGRSVSRDPKLAATWFEKAAVQNFAPAQYRLGSAYEKGVGVSRDAGLAMSWYARAAEAGNIRAMHNLAVMAAEGAAGKPDYAKAAAWFAKASAFGVRDSQFNLAILYARGLGGEQSLSQSYTWFTVAANQGDEDAAKKRDEVGQRLDAKTLAAAKAAAEAFHPTPANAAANDTPTPPGGWDAVAPGPAPQRPAPAAAKGTAAPRVSAL